MKRWIVVIIVFLILFVCLEMQPSKVCSSTIFSTSEKDEITLHVQMNTLLQVNQKQIAVEIIDEYQQINGIRPNAVYKIYLYRTGIHYRNSWKYGTIIYE